MKNWGVVSISGMTLIPSVDEMRFPEKVPNLLATVGTGMLCLKNGQRGDMKSGKVSVKGASQEEKEWGDSQPSPLPL